VTFNFRLVRVYWVLYFLKSVGGESIRLESSGYGDNGTPRIAAILIFHKKETHTYSFFFFLGNVAAFRRAEF
jgi:hypothetical protein